MKRLSFTFVAGFACAVLLLPGAGVELADRASAQSVPIPDATVNQFAQALNQADKSALQALCTAAYWNRLRVPFDQTPSPGPGAFGAWQKTGAGIVTADRGGGFLLCVQPDGVEDLTSITLRLENGAWKVCGGPLARTGASPLR
ncbi:MAG: hypothetical protein AB7T09_24665 [Planctomycetota bacterium]